MPTENEIVYVPLLDEGVDVWRPTRAQRLPDGSYKLLPTSNYDPTDEKWEFPPGSNVICERRRLSNGGRGKQVIAAVRLAARRRRTA